MSEVLATMKSSAKSPSLQNQQHLHYPLTYCLRTQRSHIKEIYDRLCAVTVGPYAVHSVTVQRQHLSSSSKYSQFDQQLGKYSSDGVLLECEAFSKQP